MKTKSIPPPPLEVKEMNAAGCLSFYGLYDCTIAATGATVTKRLHVEKGKDNRFDIPLP